MCALKYDRLERCLAEITMPAEGSPPLEEVPEHSTPVATADQDSTETENMVVWAGSTPPGTYSTGDVKGSPPVTADQDQQSGLEYNEHSTPPRLCQQIYSHFDGTHGPPRRFVPLAEQVAALGGAPGGNGQGSPPLEENRNPPVATADQDGQAVGNAGLCGRVLDPGHC